jgi:hypothetical protein
MYYLEQCNFGILSQSVHFLSLAFACHFIHSSNVQDCVCCNVLLGDFHLGNCYVHTCTVDSTTNERPVAYFIRYFTYLLLGRSFFSVPYIVKIFSLCNAARELVELSKLNICI